MTVRVLPVFPLKTVLYPRQVLPLHIFEDRYRRMLEDCLGADRMMGIVLIFSGEEANETPVPYPIGTVARIDNWHLVEPERYRVTTVGLQRFRIIEFLDSEKPYLTAAVEYWEDDHVDSLDAAELATELSRTYFDYLSLIVLLSDHSLPVARLQLPTDPTEASYHIASNLEVDVTEKQRLLEEPTAIDRLQRELVLVRRERDFLQRLVSLQGVVTSEGSGWRLGHGISDRLA